MVRSTLDVDLFSGHRFVFLASRGRGVRILFWDRNGFAIYPARLEKGRFHLPREIPEGTSALSLDPADLAMLLEGIDLRGATLGRAGSRPPRRTPRTV